MKDLRTFATMAFEHSEEEQVAAAKKTWREIATNFWKTSGQDT